MALAVPAKNHIEAHSRLVPYQGSISKGMTRGGFASLDLENTLADWQARNGSSSYFNL